MKVVAICFVLTFEIAFQSAYSQNIEEPRSPLDFSLSTNFNYGFILAHTDKVENVSNSFPLGLTTSLNWQRSDRQDFDLYNCMPRHILQIAYYDFGKSFLGRGVNIAYSLEPHFMVHEKMSIYPKVSVGLGFLSNPYDSLRNPENGAYILPVNAYLALGFGVRWQFTKQWAMNANAEYQHISNGGLYRPNIGMNWPTLGIGVEYSPRGLELKKYSKLAQPAERFKSRRSDVQVFGARVHTGFGDHGQNFLILGLNFTNSWRVSRIHAWTAAGEIYNDNYPGEHYSNASTTRLGALAGHEFLLGKYIFSQQLGVYLTGGRPDGLLYHRWGLQYFFIPRWSVGINLLAHNQNADFTDLRVTYSWLKR